MEQQQENITTPLVRPKRKTIRDVELESDTHIGNDNSEKKYSQAKPPTWDKSERADKNLPNLSDEEWEEDITEDHPSKQPQDTP